MKLKQTLAVALIVCMAVSLLGSVSVSAGTPISPTPTTLSLKSSIANTEGQGNLVTGQSFFVYGWLSNAKTGAGVSGQTIQLSYFDGDNWHYPTVTTGTNGYYTYTLSLPHSSYYTGIAEADDYYTIQASFAGSGAWAAQSNSVSVWVDPAPTRTTFYPTTFINANTATTLNGWVQNVKTGKPVANGEVYVEIDSPDYNYWAWWYVTTDSNGHFSVPLTWGAATYDGNSGTYWYNMWTHTHQQPEVNHVYALFPGQDWGSNPDYLSSYAPSSGYYPAPGIDVSVWGTYTAGM